MKKLKSHILWGILFTLILGTLAHFFYDWSGRQPLVGLFTPVNESTWEHMKLIFFPMVLYFAIAVRKYRQPSILAGLALGILAGTSLIPVLFYTYTGILGFHTLFLDILTFILSVLFGFWISRKGESSPKIQKYAPVLYLLVMVYGLAFLFFTFYPPKLPLFVPPVG